MPPYAAILPTGSGIDPGDCLVSEAFKNMSTGLSSTLSRLCGLKNFKACIALVFSSKFLLLSGGALRCLTFALSVSSYPSYCMSTWFIEPHILKLPSLSNEDVIEVTIELLSLSPSSISANSASLIIMSILDFLFFLLLPMLSVIFLFIDKGVRKLLASMESLDSSLSAVLLEVADLYIGNFDSFCVEL